MSTVHKTSQLKVEQADDGKLRLLCPDAGYFAGAHPKGATLSSGMTAGILHRLGRAERLIVPEGAGGAVVSEPRSLGMAPVEFGEVLYLLDPEGVSGAAGASGLTGADVADGGLVVKATQSGRVWHSPSPGEPVFCARGDALEDGSPLCLIEVMKTFSTVPYRPQGGLPARAKVARWLVEDGGDVTAGAPLLSVEPA